MPGPSIESVNSTSASNVGDGHKCADLLSFPFICGTMACSSDLKVVSFWNVLFLGWFLVCFNTGINPWI